MILSMALSVTWLGILTYLLVTVVEHWAKCFEVPTDIIGVTVLAVGTSAPDCLWPSRNHLVFLFP